MSATSTLLLKDHQRIIRERTFRVQDYERVLMMIQDERITGTLMLDLSTGGIASIRLREEEKITHSQK
jgi:hypothetical protein